METGYETRLIYDAMSKHFNENNTYDAVKYNFKSRYSEATFRKDRLRWQYAHLEKEINNVSELRSFKIMTALLTCEVNGFKPFVPAFAIRNNPMIRNTSSVDWIKDLCIMRTIPTRIRRAFDDIKEIQNTIKEPNKAIRIAEQRHGVVLTSCYNLLSHNLLSDGTVLPSTVSRYSKVMSILSLCIDVYSLKHK